MKFEEAVILLRQGKKVINKNQLDPKPWVIEKNNGLEEIINGDWQIYEEPVKSFPEVFAAFKEGKYIQRKSRNRIFNNESQGLYLHAEDLLATDWEICE